MNLISSLATLFGLYALAGALYSAFGSQQGLSLIESGVIHWLVIAVIAFAVAALNSLRVRNGAKRARIPKQD